MDCTTEDSRIELNLVGNPGSQWPGRDSQWHQDRHIAFVTWTRGAPGPLRIFRPGDEISGDFWRDQAGDSSRVKLFTNVQFSI